MLRVSVFFANVRLDPDPQYLGKHKRVAYHSGEMDLPSLLRRQFHSGKHKLEKTLITGSFSFVLTSSRTDFAVSANENVRDEVRNLVRPRLQQGTELLELEYQPAEKQRRWWPSNWRRKSMRSL